ncbi:MAGUK p55 subfamily member 3-like [Homarus americanus]|uniref:MAGUK p55 subfamily member 3-like n=1 Tax=Homarus americanus TaxID=6706 RepID=A0A8J5JXX6_HOMAM|nr:MAGUK p55 subfamily member 3-like [Homarus americanus]
MCLDCVVLPASRTCEVCWPSKLQQRCSDDDIVQFISLGGLLSSLEKARVQLDSDEDDFGFLADLLKSRELQALVHVHNKINRTKKACQPLMSNAEDIAISIMREIHYRTIPSGDAIELFAILQSPHLQGVLQAHDSIAAKDFVPHLPEIPVEVDEDEETVKIVQLVKSNEPMGATIKHDDRTGAIVIARIMHGGAADRSGLIHVGDEVQEVNNLNVVGKTPADVLKILMQAEGTITFKLLPAGSAAYLRESKVRVRAYFDYDPKEDKHIPCKEAGLAFKKQDILHIVTQDDPYWWQARREGDRNMRAGLIPSRQLQERRILSQRQEQTANGQMTSRPSRHGEVNNRDYQFVTREELEEEAASGTLVEHGEFKGHLYGTSSVTLKSMINAGYVVLVTPHYQALKYLRTAEFKPYVIYIKPPTLAVLKETRQAAHARSTFDENNSRGFTEDEFRDMLKAAARIEFHYSHWFDEVIVNDELSSAFELLVAAVNKVETEPLWVPASWVQ